MAKPLIQTRSLMSFERNTARLSIATGALFLLLLGSLHLIEPEFDPAWRFISEYTLGRFGWMMTLAFLALAVSLAGVGTTIFSQVRTVVGYAGLALGAVGVVALLLFGSCRLIAG